MHAPNARTSLAWSLGLTCTVLALACPPYLSGFEPTSAALPPDAASAKLELAASVPQGDWLLRFSVYGTLEVESAEPPDRIEELGCLGSGCSGREYRLRCPRGMCSFGFQLAATRDASGPLEVAAGFAFDEDPGDHGCGDEPNPDYVPAGDRDRLFQLSWSVSDLVQAPFEDPDATQRDASDHDAAEVEAQEPDAAVEDVDADPGFPILPLDAGPCALWTIEASPEEALCSYVMPLPVSEPRTLLVSVGGVRRARDDTEDGWRLEPDQRTVILLGAACEQARTGVTWEITLLCMHPIAI